MPLATSALSAGWTFADLLYPPACLLCRARATSSVSPLCEVCEAAMPKLLPPVCMRCGVGLPGAFDAHMTCSSCQRRPPIFERACAPLAYAASAREAIQAFKYYGRHRLGSWLAVHMAHAAQRAIPLAEVNAVVPVPLHWIKRRLRRLDSPAFLARALATALERPYVPLLRRTRWTATQTALSPAARLRNVRGAFVVRMAPQEFNLFSQGVLLVDDVMTSGATVNACAHALRDAGIHPVYIVTAARTPLT